MGSFNSTLISFVQHIIASLPRQIERRALRILTHRNTSKSCRGRCFNNGDVLDQFRFHRWGDLALLFKKGWSRDCCAWIGFFSNVQHSRNPALLLPYIFTFCGRCTAGDFSPSTFCVHNFSWRLCLCILVANATLLQLWGSRWRKLPPSREVFPRFARQCGSQEK